MIPNNTLSWGSRLATLPTPAPAFALSSAVRSPETALPLPSVRPEPMKDPEDEEEKEPDARDLIFASNPLQLQLADYSK